MAACLHSEHRLGVGVGAALPGERTDQGEALDALIALVLAARVDEVRASVSHVSQDGVWLSAGSASFRREERLQTLLAESRKHLKGLKHQTARGRGSPEAAARHAGTGQCGQQIRKKQLRVGTGDPQERVVKMAKGGYQAAFNAQLASDPNSRAIVGVEVSNEGTDSAGLSQPMRQQIERRSGKKSPAALAGWWLLAHPGH